MTRRLVRATVAELLKILSLPVMIAAVLGTIAAAALLAAVIAASAPPTEDAGLVTARMIGLLQAGPILLGVLVAGTEYSGRQIATTLTAVPDRPLLLAGKTLAHVTIATATGLTAVAAALAAAGLTLALRTDRSGGTAAARQPIEGAAMIGAVTYLVLIGLLALELAVLLRSLMAPLVGMLGWVFVISPVLAAHVTPVWWLPDRAGSLLYAPDAHAVLGPVAGAAVLLLWTALAAAVAGTALVLRDA